MGAVHVDDTVVMRLKAPLAEELGIMILSREI
jgi:hypothetical protein